MLDVASLTQPVTADDPCGPDLDASGDIQYLNFFAGAESLLPMSYFEVVNANGERGRFDPKAIDFAGQFAAARPLLARTRDLRLNMLLAKFSILNRDLEGFLNCLKATTILLRGAVGSGTSEGRRRRLRSSRCHDRRDRCVSDRDQSPAIPSADRKSKARHPQLPCLSGCQGRNSRR
ncbi:type VI secretion system ImpA family N-terminal domain-containing protein [Bradyrhizobium sp. RDM12]